MFYSGRVSRRVFQRGQLMKGVTPPKERQQSILSRAHSRVSEGQPSYGRKPKQIRYLGRGGLQERGPRTAHGGEALEPNI